MDNQTAKDFIASNLQGFPEKEKLEKLLVQFAQTKVEAALEAAAEKATMKGRGMYTDCDLGETGDSVIVNRDNADDEVWEINKDSILKAYPKELIK